MKSIYTWSKCIFIIMRFLHFSCKTREQSYQSAVIITLLSVHTELSFLVFYNLSNLFSLKFLWTKPRSSVFLIFGQT